MNSAAYDPGVFVNVNSIDAAKRIILTPEKELSTDQRWSAETPHVCDLIEHQVRLTGRSVVVDYGCGVGRIAKELIRRHACRVIGVDIAPNMRALAASYVKSDRFFAVAPDMLDMVKPQADLVVAVWTLQHVLSPGVETARIREMMKIDGAWLFVVNEVKHRFIPTDRGWMDDGLDVRKHLGERFRLIKDGRLDEDIVGPDQSERTFWAAYSTHGRRQ